MQLRKTIGLALLVGLLPLNGARADIDLWPLLEISDESTTVLYPLFVREGEVPDDLSRVLPHGRRS